MIEAFIRGDNRPNRDLLAAGTHRSSIRAIPSSGPLGVSRSQQKLREWFQSAKTARSVAHVAYWNEESEAR